MAIKTVDDLAAALKAGGYKMRSDDELREQAENLYRNQLDQQKLSAQQSYDENAAALQQQLATIGTGYDRQIESQQKATRQTLGQADRLALSRGMGRSSYNNATMANIQLEGDKAVGRIQEDRTAAENSISGQLTQLQRQLQENLGAADSAFQNNVIAEIQRLRDQDYERGMSDRSYSSSLALQLLSNGQMPTAELLRGAGISDADAQSFLNIYNAAHAASGYVGAPVKKTTNPGSSGDNAGDMSDLDWMNRMNAQQPAAQTQKQNLPPVFNKTVQTTLEKKLSKANSRLTTRD